MSRWMWWRSASRGHGIGMLPLLLVGWWFCVMPPSPVAAGTPLRAPEVGFLNWYASAGLDARETYTIRLYSDGTRVTCRYQRHHGEETVVSRSRLVLAPDGAPDSLYYWPVHDGPALIHAVPDSLRSADPYPFDPRAGLHLLAFLVGRHAPTDSLPRHVALLPSGEMTIRRVATDSVFAAGASLNVHRYRIDGLSSGPWHLWLNDADQRPLAGLALGAERGACAEGFGRVLLTLARLAWQSESPPVVARLAAAATRSAGMTAYVGMAIDDGAGRRYQPGVILVEDGVIVDAGAAGEVDIPAAARRIDLADCLIRPGRSLEGGTAAPDSLLAALRQGYTTVVARRGYFGEMAQVMVTDLGTAWPGPHLRVPSPPDSLATSAGATLDGELVAGGVADFVVSCGAGGDQERVTAVVCGGVLIDLRQLAVPLPDH